MAIATIKENYNTRITQYRLALINLMQMYCSF